VPTTHTLYCVCGCDLFNFGNVVVFFYTQLIGHVQAKVEDNFQLKLLKILASRSITLLNHNLDSKRFIKSITNFDEAT
jgi:hypothetical protein